MWSVVVCEPKSRRRAASYPGHHYHPCLSLSLSQAQSLRPQPGFHKRALDGYVILVPRSGTTSWPRRGLGAAA
eukprot:scaffold100435_cov76-Phaeocystis_antarctica.AAC.1